QFDYNKINLSVAQLDSKFKELEGKRQLVLLNLHMLTKIDLARLEQIDPNLDVLSVNYVNSAENRAELLALDAAVRANEYKVKAAKTWWVPKVGASASLSYYGLHNGHLKTNDPFLLTYPNPLNYSI